MQNFLTFIISIYNYFFSSFLLDRLSTLLSQYNVSREKLEEECDDNLIIEVSQHIKDHNEICYYLNLSNDELTHISQSKEDNVDGKIDILVTWKRKNGSAATVLALLEAFLEMGDQSVAESILEYFLQKTTSEPLQTPSTCTLAHNKTTSHYPNWETLTESENEAVRHQLMDENHDVRKAYTNLSCHLYVRLNLAKLTQMIFNY